MNQCEAAQKWKTEAANVTEWKNQRRELEGLEVRELKSAK